METAHVKVEPDHMHFIINGYQTFMCHPAFQLLSLPIGDGLRWPSDRRIISSRFADIEFDTRYPGRTYFSVHHGTPCFAESQHTLVLRTR